MSIYRKATPVKEEVGGATIRCIKKDSRIGSIDVGDLGTTTIERTTMNTWYRIEFAATPSRANIATHYREPEFLEFFEVVPDYDAKVLHLKKLIAADRQHIEHLQAEIRRYEEGIARLQSGLEEVEAKKAAEEAKWSKA